MAQQWAVQERAEQNLFVECQLMKASGTHGPRRSVEESYSHLASVVIPAHNEEEVLQRCLCALTRGLEPGEVEIIVVCN